MNWMGNHTDIEAINPSFLISQMRNRMTELWLSEKKIEKLEEFHLECLKLSRTIYEYLSCCPEIVDLLRSPLSNGLKVASSILWPDSIQIAKIRWFIDIVFSPSIPEEVRMCFAHITAWDREEWIYLQRIMYFLAYWREYNWEIGWMPYSEGNVDMLVKANVFINLYANFYEFIAQTLVVSSTKKTPRRVYSLLDKELRNLPTNFSMLWIQNIHSDQGVIYLEEYLSLKAYWFSEVRTYWFTDDGKQDREKYWVNMENIWRAFFRKHILLLWNLDHQITWEVAAILWDKFPIIYYDTLKAMENQSAKVIEEPKKWPKIILANNGWISQWEIGIPEDFAFPIPELKSGKLSGLSHQYPKTVELSFADFRNVPYQAQTCIFILAPADNWWIEVLILRQNQKIALRYNRDFTYRFFMKRLEDDGTITIDDFYNSRSTLEVQIVKKITVATELSATQTRTNNVLAWILSTDNLGIPVDAWELDTDNVSDNANIADISP